MDIYLICGFLLGAYETVVVLYRLFETKTITNPTESLYRRILRWQLRPIMVWLAGAKISYGWNWLDYSMLAADVDKGVYVDADSFAPPHQLGWRECVVLKPTQSQKVWFLVFSSRAEGKLIQRRCAIELTGQIRALIGPAAVWFLGLRPDGQIIHLDLVRRTRRDEPEWQHLPLV